MRLALDSLHSRTRWQHTAVNMLKSMRRSSLDVTTWTHVEETQHRRQFTDDSAPTFRWLQFTSVHLLIFIYLFFVFGTGTESKKFSGGKKSVIIQSLLSPPMPCWSHYSQILQNRGKKIQGTDDHQMNKYHSRISTKSFSMQRWIHWQRLQLMALWSLWQHVDIMLWNLHHRRRRQSIAYLVGKWC